MPRWLRALLSPGTSLEKLRLCVGGVLGVITFWVLLDYSLLVATIVGVLAVLWSFFILPPLPRSRRTDRTSL
ncbi:MAG: hypothetical protein D6736_06370 [Nitrospinota bacterium]|nr:MAG: hypothetical protein D6736_06370 [Nitrospinota bacterium]